MGRDKIGEYEEIEEYGEIEEIEEATIYTVDIASLAPFQNSTSEILWHDFCFVDFLYNHAVGWRYDTRSTVSNMGVDHGGRDIAMAEQFLHCANVVSVLDQMGGETVAHGVTACLFRYSGIDHGLSHSLLHRGIVDMMPAFYFRSRIYRDAARREYILPLPLGRSRWIFLIERTREMNRSVSGSEIAIMLALDENKVRFQRFDDAGW